MKNRFCFSGTQTLCYTLPMPDSDAIGELSKRIDDLRTDVTGRLDEIARRLERLEGQQISLFRWTITTMVALFGIAVPIWMWVLSLILKPLL